MDRTWMAWGALLEELGRAPERLRRLTEVLGPAGCVRPESGEWSVCENLAHLCAVESPYRARLVRMTLEENPYVTAIESITGGYDPATPIAILLDTFTALRAGTIAFLETLPAAARARPAVHAELGNITLRGQVEALLAHDTNHLEHIALLVQGMTAGGPV